MSPLKLYFECGIKRALFGMLDASEVCMARLTKQPEAKNASSPQEGEDFF